MVGYACLPSSSSWKLPGAACQDSGLVGPHAGVVQLWCQEASSGEGDIPVSAVVAAHPCLGTCVPSGGSQRPPRAAHCGGGLMGPVCWSSATTVSSGQQPGRGKSHFLQQGPCPLAWVCARPAAHRGTQDMPAGQWSQGSRALDLCDHGVWRPAAREGEAPVSAAKLLHPLRWTSWV